MRRFILSLIGAVALTGCVQTDTTMISSDTASISAIGSAFDTMDGVIAKTLLEAAKTTKAHGYRYFLVLNSQNTSFQSQVYTPGQTTTTGSISGTATGASFNATSTSSPGFMNTVVYAGQNVTFKMFPESAGVPNGGWDADDIIRTQTAPKK